MIEIVEAINGKGKKLPEEVTSFRIKERNNIAADRSQICIMATSSLDNPDNRENKVVAGLNERASLVASGYAIPGRITDIKVEFEQSGQSDNHIIKNSGKGHILCPIFAKDGEKNNNRAPDPDKTNPVFDPPTIATEMLRYHERAKKLASKRNT